MFRAKPSARLVLAFVAMLVGSAACTAPAARDAEADGPDGAIDTPPSACTTDHDCDDGLFCTGRETCAPMLPNADARGCVRGAMPCSNTLRCDESRARCVLDCVHGGDLDGDGHITAECPGGDDCDDNDSRRFPGNAEFCDNGHDEDCNPATIHGVDMATGTSRDGDDDHDGVVSVLCCNVAVGGTRTCGHDCDDHAAQVSPLADEVCDGIDNDCDGSIDEGLARVDWYPDCDGDSFGDRTRAAITACAPPPPSAGCATPSPTSRFVTDARDCDDHDARVHPGANDVCNGRDDDCDGVVDTDPAASAGCPVAPSALSMTCSAGQCIVAACAAGRGDCDRIPVNGCEIDLQSHSENCGECHYACRASNGSAACHSGACEVVACDGGYHACPSGCVANDSPASCGTSCLPCPAGPNATATCYGGVCGIVCAAGYHVCGDQCADDHAPATCGGRCSPCPIGLHEAATCDGSTCGVTCAPGYLRSDRLCVPGPRLIFPPSGSTSTTRRPRFRWELAPGFDAARIDVCSDRACSVVLATFDAAGTSAEPSSDLPPGMVFWRARGLTRGVLSSVVGPTWQVTIPHRSAPVGTFIGSTSDFNGDGYADVAFGHDPLNVFWGGAVPASTPTVTSIDNRDSIPIQPPASAGDMNGDGFVDLVQATAAGPVVFFGRASGFGSSATPDLVLPIAQPAGSFIDIAGAGGDVDGDGYGDLVAVVSSNFVGFIHIYRGGPDGAWGTGAPIILTDPSVGDTRSFAAGDLNGDTYTDLVMPSARGDGSGAMMFFFYGGAAGIARTPSATIMETGRRDPVTIVDVNGDGYADVIANSAQSAVYSGSSAGVVTSAPSQILSGTPVPVVRAGDIDGDGFEDVLGYSYTSLSELSVFRGSASGLAYSPAIRFPSRTMYISYISMTGFGDIDGDGFGEYGILGDSLEIYHGAAVLSGTPSVWRSVMFALLERPARVPRRLARSDRPRNGGTL